MSAVEEIEAAIETILAQAKLLHAQGIDSTLTVLVGETGVRIKLEQVTHTQLDVRPCSAVQLESN